MPCGDGTGPVWANVGQWWMGRRRAQGMRPWEHGATFDADSERALLKRRAEYLKNQLNDIESRLSKEDGDSIL